MAAYKIETKTYFGLVHHNRKVRATTAAEL